MPAVVDVIREKFCGNVFSFTDYRTFLNSYLDEKKSHNRHYSTSLFSKDLKLRDTSSINKILKSQRHAGSEIVDKICDYFHFSDKERYFFCDLVSLAKETGSSTNRLYIMERLKRLHPNNNFRLLKQEEFNAISQWYYVAIREMVQWKGFQESSEWIQKQLLFKVTKSQIKEALCALEKIGLIKRGKNGRLELGTKQFTTTQDISDEAIKKFHEKSLECAKTSVRDVEVQKRHISSTIISVKAANIKKAKEVIDRFQDELSGLIEDGEGDAIYQLNIQYYPLTKVKTEVL